MAAVFLSYDRRDSKRARTIAGSLEKSGHSVWWDLHVRGGAQFGKVIEEALKRADVVVVLWSSNSVESAWVRDEAAVGRDTGRLIPVALDKTEPPLGFRQYQTIDLMGWSGRGQPEGLRTLLSAIDALAPTSQHVSDPAKPLPTEKNGRVGILLASLAVIVAIALILVALPKLGETEVPTVAVAPTDSTALNRELATDLMVSLDGLSAARADSMRLLDNASISDPDLRFEVGSFKEQGQIGASVVLTDARDRSIMWSRRFRDTAGKMSDLKQLVAYTSAGVLECALEALSARPKLKLGAQKLFLNACANGEEVDDPRNVLPLFRDVVKQEPQFQGGWKGLLTTESAIVGTESYPESARTKPILRRHIEEARKLDPQMPEAFIAELFLIPGSDIDGQMEVISRAIAAHPDDPGINSQLSFLLALVGRTREATAYAKRAAELDPLSPSLMATYVTMLGWTGQQEAARSVLAAAEKRWPGATSVLDARWRYHLRFGDPKEAFRLIESGAVENYDLRSYLRARIDPTPENIQRAVEEGEVAARSAPRQIGLLIQTLGEFGRNDEAYDLLLHGPQWDPTFVNQSIFRPGMRGFRRDPRMMQVAKKSGLVNYWLKSGKWPDFCSEPDLPYDCRKEVAKLS